MCQPNDKTTEILKFKKWREKNEKKKRDVMWYVEQKEAFQHKWTGVPGNE